jgi:hypothetical protein
MFVAPNPRRAFRPRSPYRGAGMLKAAALMIFPRGGVRLVKVERYAGNQIRSPWALFENGQCAKARKQIEPPW